MKTIVLLLAPDDLGVAPIFGVPAVRRLVLILRRLNLDGIHVLGRVDALRPLLSNLLPAEAFHGVENQNDLQALPARLSLPHNGRFLLLKTSLVVDRPALARLLETIDPPGCTSLRSDEGDELGMRVAGEASDLPPFLAQLWDGRSEGDLPTTARMVTGPAGLPHLLKEGPGQISTAERKLTRSLAFQSHDDGFLARHFDRKISRFISRRLARRRVTPNWITLGGVLVGSAGAFLLSRPGYGAQVAGALLFLFCVIVDGVDGEVARLKVMESVFGHYLDVITDNLVHVAVFVGIAYGLFHASGNPIYLHALWWMMGGFGLCLIAVYQCILRRTPEALAQSPKAVRLMALLSNRDFAYLVALLALIGRLDWFLLGAAAGTYLFAAILWIVSAFETRAVVSSGAP